MSEIKPSLISMRQGASMSKAFIAWMLQQSTEVTGAAANRATNELLNSIVAELKKAGKFTVSGFGTFTVHKTKARKVLKPQNRRGGQSQSRQNGPLQGVASS